MNEWLTPGLTALVEAVVSKLCEGSSVVVRIPRLFPAGLESRVRAAARESGETLRRIDPDERSPARQLMSALNPDDPALGAEINTACLLDKPDQEGMVFWLRLADTTRTTPWLKFLDDVATLRRAHPDRLSPRLLLLLEEGALTCAVGRKVGIEVLDADAHLDFIDLLLVAMHRARMTCGSGIKSQLVGQTCSHLSIWDFGLLDRLLDEPMERLFQPGPVLMDYASELDWSPETTPDWTNGGLKTCNGTVRVHSSLAALRGDSQDLTSRVWSGQASVLMPILETRRQEIVDAYWDILGACLPWKNLYEEWIQSPDDLELGEVDYLLSRSGVVSARVKAIKNARNELSHLRSLPPSKALSSEIVSRFAR